MASSGNDGIFWKENGPGRKARRNRTVSGELRGRGDSRCGLDGQGTAVGQNEG